MLHDEKKAATDKNIVKKTIHEQKFNLNRNAFTESHTDVNKKLLESFLFAK